MDELERYRRQLAKSRIMWDGSKYRPAISDKELSDYLSGSLLGAGKRRKAQS